jgi:glycosyltransferase involved in cell wall biosynthesis
MLKQICPTEEAYLCDGRIIGEVCAAGAPETRPLEHGAQVGGWRIATKARAPDGMVILSPEGEMTLTWPVQVKRIRLSQAIDIGHVAPSDDGYQIDLHIELRQNVSARNPVEWVAILASETADPHSELRFVHKFSVRQQASAKGIVLQATAQIDRFDPDRLYQFCIQFHADGEKATLHDIALTVVPSPVAEESVETAADLHAPDDQPNRRPKAVIIAWEVGHNPVGRAFLIADMLCKDYDVELIGPQFDRYGKDVWSPLRDSTLAFRSFPASTMDDFLEQAVPFVAACRPDIVVACKPRLPSILLALLIKHRVGCPMFIDVDDHELSFFPNRAPLALSDLIADPAAFADLDQPFGESWTRVCEALVPLFDGVIVSNASLQDRFGGMVVRHARDEKRFRRDEDVRGRVRKEFGFTPQDKVILFLGTPRLHKGVMRIAEALDRLQDDRLVLCIIGSSHDKRVDNQLSGHAHARIKMFPDQPWDRLSDLINIADGVCLLQDLSSPVAEYQIPAKLTEALATGVPVAVTQAAPFRDIPAPHIITPIRDDADLEDFLRNVAEGVFDTDAYRLRARQYFIGEMSYAVNGARLELLFETARTKPAQWQREWIRLVHFLSRHWSKSLPAQQPEWARGGLNFPAVIRSAPFDIAFFWKQNDTGIYGRRHDMVLKYLARHPRVGRIVQFDAPMTLHDLTSRTRLDPDAGLDQGNMVVENSIRRFLKIADDKDMARRVFLHRGKRPSGNFLGQDLPALDAYPQWVEETVRQTLGNGPVVSWVAPIAPAYPAVHDYMNFSLTVADLIDDQRTMTEGAARDRTEQAYAEMIDRADLLLSNCESLKHAFAPFGRDIMVIPNAAENIPRTGKVAKPAELAGMDGKIVGYVGNLRDRIDIWLLDSMAVRHPEWNIVLIGSAHGKTDVLDLRRHANVHFLGVKRYEEALDYIRAFDVAIMPHLDNDVSQFMNPLKLYVYLSAGVPIVTSAVANIGEVAPFATVARDSDDFIAKVEATLAGQAEAKPATRLPPTLRWEARVDRMIAAIDERL